MSIQVADGGKVWNYQSKADPTAAQQKAQEIHKARMKKFMLFRFTPLALLSLAAPLIVKQFLPFRSTTQEPSIAGGFGAVHMDTSMVSLVMLSLGAVVLIFGLFLFASYKFNISQRMFLLCMVGFTLLFFASMSIIVAINKQPTQDEFSYSKWANEQYGYTDLKDRGTKHGAAVFDAKDKYGNAIVLHEFESDNNKYLYENNAQLRDILDKIDAAKEAKQ